MATVIPARLARAVPVPTEQAEDRVNERQVTTPNRMRGFAAVVLNVVALLLFGVGLLAPLTPSYGWPDAANVALFAGGPAVLLFVANRFATSRLGRLVTAFEGFALVVVSCAILLRFARTSP